MTFRRRLISLGMVFMIITSLSACNIDPEPTPIKNGFSKELVSMLKDKYHLNIPKEAVFIKGYYDNAVQDDAVHITFKVPSKLCDSLYDDTWFKSSSGRISADGSESAERIIEYGGEMFTCLCFQPPNDDETVTVYFQGRHPQKTIT